MSCPARTAFSHLGDDRVLKAHDAGEERRALSHAGHQVLADLLTDGEDAVAGLA